MKDFKKHIISSDSTVKQALEQLNILGYDAILFIVNQHNELLGSLTDGDIRRGFLKDFNFETPIIDFVQKNPIFYFEGDSHYKDFEVNKAKGIKVIPIVNKFKQITDVLNLRLQEGNIPVDAVLMAGGEGKRLRPLTEKIPKPLVIIGDKPIIEHNIDRLKKYGVTDIHLSINYLGHLLEDYFKDGSNKDLNIKYVREDKPMGTIGSILLVEEFYHDDIIVMNSDLLTNIDFEDFYKSFKDSNADMAVAATSYHVDIPYAIIDIDDQFNALGLKEKPRYTYYSNAGIYLLKKEILNLIPKGEYFDITDLMEKVIETGKKLKTYPIKGYWLDIGKMPDYEKAQVDILTLDL